MLWSQSIWILKFQQVCYVLQLSERTKLINTADLCQRKYESESGTWQDPELHCSDQVFQCCALHCIAAQCIAALCYVVQILPAAVWFAVSKHFCKMQIECSLCKVFTVQNSVAVFSILPAVVLSPWQVVSSGQTILECGSRCSQWWRCCQCSSWYYAHPPSPLLQSYQPP